MTNVETQFIPSIDAPKEAPSVTRVPPVEPRSMFDLVLRGQKKLSEQLTNERVLAESIHKLVVLSIAGFAVHGFIVGLSLQWTGEGGKLPVLWMPVAFALAFLGALCVCLPSFYFYTQLAGFDASFRLVTAQALRTNATTSVLLLGVAPFFAAYALACGLGYLDNGVERIYRMGYVLPFLVGLFGVKALYESFRDLSTVLPQTHARRGNVLTRMVMCWGAIYSVIAPIALWRLADKLPTSIERLLH